VLKRGPERVADGVAAFQGTLRNRNLLRTQSAFGLVWASEWAFTVALSVLAFGDGGAAAVGLVAALRIAPGAVLTPVATALADRLPRDRILIGAGGLRAVATAAAALAAALGAPAPVIYALAVVATAAFTVVRPAHKALLPALSRSPQELTATTVVRGLIDSAGTLIGPLVAAVVLAVASPAAVFAIVAVASAASAFLISRVVYEPAPRLAVVRHNLLREAAAGFAVMARSSDARLVAAIALAQTFTRGCVGVLLVVLAIDQLGDGAAAVGWLTAAIGAGAVAGSLGAGLLADARNLARWEGVGVALWGVPLLLCAALPSLLPALLFLTAAGVGSALVDVGLFTLPVRLVPDELLARFFGVFESLACVSVALGSLLAPLAVDAFGVRGALVAVGLVCPSLILLVWPGLARIDRTMVAREDVVRALRAVPLLRPLPVPAIEWLANHAVARTVPAGATVVREGEEAEAYFVITGGRVRVSRHRRKIRTLGPGQGFGEIALLRPTKRTATAAAYGGDLQLYVLRRRDFLPAVTGFRPATAEAEARVAALDGARG
jgi:MFS family permease